MANSTLLNEAKSHVSTGVHLVRWEAVAMLRDSISKCALQSTAFLWRISRYAAWSRDLLPHDSSLYVTLPLAKSLIP